MLNEGKCWTEFYKYAKLRKGNRDNIPTIKDCNGRLINDSIDKGNSLNSCYATLFGCERNVTQTTTTHSAEPFTIDIKMVRKRLAAVGRSKSIWPEDVPGEILKLDVEAVFPLLARLLDITFNHATIPSDWKRAVVAPTYSFTYLWLQVIQSKYLCVIGNISDVPPLPACTTL